MLKDKREWSTKLKPVRNDRITIHTAHVGTETLVIILRDNVETVLRLSMSGSYFDSYLLRENRMHSRKGKAYVNSMSRMED